MTLTAGAKLLDFGLAKLKQQMQPAAALSSMPTDADVTAKGAILGTLHTCPLNNWKGKKPTRNRTSLHSVRCFTRWRQGKKAFQGKTQASLIASILASQRRLGRLPFNVRAASEYRESHA